MPFLFADLRDVFSIVLVVQSPENNIPPSSPSSHEEFPLSYGTDPVTYLRLTERRAMAILFVHLLKRETDPAVLSRGL